ncbi:MAG: hypothetical protein FWG26_02525 [Betaproteobacteria bacterium]|nr:hypothetical protein [Betaproteobacteria bacterium]
MKKYTVTCTEACGHCDGTGFVPDSHSTPEELACAGGMCGMCEEICPECKGKGRSVREVDLADALRDLGLLSA